VGVAEIRGWSGFPRHGRMGIDGLQTDDEMPESAAKTIDRRETSDTNIGDSGNDPEMTKRCRRGTHKARWAASQAQVSTAAPRSCVSRGSPAAACRLAITETTHARMTNSPERWGEWPRYGGRSASAALGNRHGIDDVVLRKKT
jgi:hypothetical protein